MAYQPKSYRKFLATSVTAAMVASAVAPVAALAADANFNDIDNVKSWAGDAIEYLVDKGAIEGKGANKFAPYDQLTRAEAATILARALDLNISDNEKTDFADAKDHWGSKYIAAIQRQLPGVINGYNGKFNPNDNVTRQEMAKMIVEAYELEAAEGIEVNFPDNNGWGKEYVNILSSLGVVEGKPGGNFAPNANIQRAEAAVLFHRTEVEEVRLIEELAVKNVDVLDAKTIQVTFNDGGSEQYTVPELKIGEQTEIEIEYKGEKFKVVVTYDPNQVAAPGSVKFDNQPTAKALPFSSQLNEVYKFQVTAGEDDITLRSVQLKQHGTARASSDDITNVHLAVNGDIRATGSLNANGEVRLTRSINIPANSTIEISVLADINAAATATTPGATPTATVQFGIESIDAFTANAKLNGSFPNVGSSFNIVAGNIGTVRVTGQNPPNSGTNYSVDTGDLQEELGKFTLQAGTEEGVKVKRITLNANGLNADDIENLYLYQNNGQDKIDVQGVASRNEVVFDLSDKGIEISRNQAKSFVLKGDPQEAVSGTNNGFEFQNSYDLVAEGLNTGYNNGNDISTGKSLGTVEVSLGKPKFRVSTKTPNQGDKIVASTSEYGVVREYTFNPAGQDLTLKSADIQISASGITAPGVSNPVLENAVRTIEIYDANSGAVIHSYDVDGNTPLNTDITLNGLNWSVDKSFDLQIRAIATADEVKVQNFDVFISDLRYEVQTSTGSKKNDNVAGPVTSAQPKEFTTSGGIEISRPESARIDGYSISGGLSKAPFGGFRVEAKDEAIKVTDAKVKVSGTGSGVGDLTKLLANPVLLYDNEIVAYGDVKTNGIIEFDFNDDFVVETGTNNRKVLKMQADVLESAVDRSIDIAVELNELKTRGVTSNIVSTHGYDASTNNAVSLLSDNTKMDYRETSVAVDVSNEKIDTLATTNTHILKFKVYNLSPNSPSNKSVTIEEFGFTNLFNFPNNSSTFNYELRDDKSKLIERKDSTGSVLGYYKGTAAGRDLLLQPVDTATPPALDSSPTGLFSLKGDDDKEFFLYADLLTEKAANNDDSIYKNVRMRLDIDAGAWTITDNSGNSTNNDITPLLYNDEGPDITITE